MFYIKNHRKEGGITVHMKILSKITRILAILGLLAIFVIWVTNSAYPSKLFTVLLMTSISCIFLALFLFLLENVLSVIHDIKTRQYVSAIMTILFLIFLFFIYFR